MGLNRFIATRVCPCYNKCRECRTHVARLLSPPALCRMEDELLAGTVSPEAAAAAVVPSPMAATSPAAPPPSNSTSAPTAPGLSWGRGALAGGSEGGLPREAPVAGGVAEGARGAASAAKAPPCPELVLLLEVVDRLEGTGGST